MNWPDSDGVQGNPGVNEDDLIKLLRDLNANGIPYNCFVREVGPKIMWMRRWDLHIENGVEDIASSAFYLIKQNLVYVGVVYQMDRTDLHWLVLPEHRGNGYMHNALKCILPRVAASDPRGEVRITCVSPLAFAYAERQGFRKCLSRPHGLVWASSLDKIGVEVDPESVLYTDEELLFLLYMLSGADARLGGTVEAMATLENKYLSGSNNISLKLESIAEKIINLMTKKDKLKG